MAASPRYQLIDCDSHITEPPDLWTSRVEARFKDRVPTVRWVEQDAMECWFIGGMKCGAVGSTAVAGYKDPFPAWPPTYADTHPAARDANARLAYMDGAGIWAQVLYPNVGGFGNQAFLKLGDPELMLACVRAYNDFLIDWSSADRRRFVTNVTLPFWDVAASVNEIDRCAKLGFKSILFTGAPQDFGFPFLSDSHWDPLWSAAVETGLPISFHIGGGDMNFEGVSKRIKSEGVPTTAARASCNLFLENGMALSDLLFSGVLQRHPKIRFVSVESGIGWIPFILEAADYQFDTNRVFAARPDFKMMPSDYFRQNVYACYWFEKRAPRDTLDAIGVDHILFETDFPHPTCLYGNVQETVEAGLAKEPVEVRRKILVDNAAALYGVELPSYVRAA